MGEPLVAYSHISSRTIEPPERSSLGGSLVISLCIVAFLLAVVTPGESIGTAGFFVLLMPIAFFRGSTQALHLSLVLFAITAAPLVSALFRNWPFSLLVPLIMYFLIAISVPKLRKTLLWVRRGHLGKDVLILVVATAAISGIALYLWNDALHPDLSRHLAYIPHVPFWTYPFMGIGFAALNAAMEEAAFRGIVMQSTDSAFGPGVLSLLLQAVLFGALHFLQGFPRGAWGFGMALFYGIMLGHIRRKSRGMLAPWLAHVCADLVIFAILVNILLGKSLLADAAGR
jgi:membrane protease YdiL (CAAX protease family)